MKQMKQMKQVKQVKQAKQAKQVKQVKQVKCEYSRHVKYMCTFPHPMRHNPRAGAAGPDVLLPIKITSMSLQFFTCFTPGAVEEVEEVEVY